ncbi:MAG: DUF479 domain-containing protein [Marinilabiliaceae bacterium]|nr:DUF479 domain-containing protein [Marinilabiliaceae bacterium]
MNYLAHIYLSGNNNDIKIGNFIGDFVKGRQYEKYSELIQKGILLHRKIDVFTDTHPVVKKSASLLKEGYNRYSGVVVDLFYDHFLAVNWSDYENVSLSEYVSNIHNLLIKNYFRLPGGVKSILPFLIRNRRLENYRYINGIEKSLSIMTRYTGMPPQVDFAIRQLELNYNVFQSDFRIFFDEVRSMVSCELVK